MGTCSGATGTVRLTSTEAAGLQYMVEEEKLAHDVYTVLADRYPDAPFAVIAQSEQRHQAAVQRQITRAGLTDPTSNRAAGVFDNPNLQRLYNTLVKRGTTSPAAALQVGALIERTDIADLQARSNATSRCSDQACVRPPRAGLRTTPADLRDQLHTRGVRQGKRPASVVSAPTAGKPPPSETPPWRRPPARKVRNSPPAVSALQRDRACPYP